MTPPTSSLSRRNLLRLAPGALMPSLEAAAAPTASIEPIEVISLQPRSYHAWPTMVQSRSGELLAAYSGGREGHHCPFGRLELIRSRDGGRTWSWPQVVMDTAIDDRDAGLAETARGTLLISTFTSLGYERVLGEAKGWEQDRLERWNAVQKATTPEQRRSLLGAWMVRSTDGGLTWSTPYRVPITAPHGPVALSSGRLLFAGKEYPRAQNRIGVCESSDDGLTWRWVGQIPSRPGDDPLQYHELHLVEATDKRLIVHIRNQNKANERETLQSESSDGGVTWTVPRPIGVWGLPSHLIRLRDGRLLMTYGYRRMPRGNHARISADNGATWSEPIIISNDGVGDIGYPSTVELADGKLVTVWYESKRSGSVPVKLPEPPFSVLRAARWTLR